MSECNCDKDSNGTLKCPVCTVTMPAVEITDITEKLIELSSTVCNEAADEIYKLRGELATVRAEKLALAMKLNKLESKYSTLHFNHKEI